LYILAISAIIDRIDKELTAMASSTASSTEVKNNFGNYLEETRVGPVMIQRNGRDVAVLLSIEEYNTLMGESDTYWILRAELSMRTGEPDIVVDPQALLEEVRLRDRKVAA
jgi:antitoxin Phd